MPLSTPSARDLIHTREVTCRGYRREDGLWDIEGHLTDVKTYPFDNSYRGAIQPGDPIHDMWVRMTVDDRLVIQEMEVVTDKSPFAICPAITPAFQKLVGLRVGRGFREALKERVGGTGGCTHINEMFTPLATTAFQTVFSYKDREARLAREAGENAPETRSEGQTGSDLERGQMDQKPKRKPPHLDTCHALRSDGDVVKEFWPEHYDPPEATSGG